MNLSDPSDDDSSSDESTVAAKRSRADTYGASSTTSHGSALQESDKESPETPIAENNYGDFQQPGKIRQNYRDQSPEENIRLSRSSLSENCSSPSDQFDDYRPGFDEGDDGDGSTRPTFQDSGDTFYNKINSDPNNKFEDAYSGEYSEKSKRMMKNMGFKPGKGLGKFEHGRTQPVEASTQKGRRGLGAKPSAVGALPEIKHITEESKPEAREQVLWLDPASEEPCSGEVLEKWLRRGPKKTTIDDETEFVDPEILKGVLDSKTIFDSLDDEDLRHARFRSNPYETIGSVVFLNRAAVKMANIDAVFDFNFTNPKKQNGEDAVDVKEILYFADVCAGPGGFSEYVLFRKGWRAKGFGFTLKGLNDFKLSDFYAGSPETFHAYYGVKDDGNIFDPANLSSLKEHVLRQTEDKGVHFLMADGGFSVQGQENIQEILSKQLYLCQCLAALMLVRTGGHFVVKLFDVFTLFSVGLIYILYRCFDKVCIHKPVTSRPANSERYLICMWKRLGTEPSEQHLASVNSMLWSDVERGGDVSQLVPLSVIKSDKNFFDYIYKSNCLLGERQIQNLLKIAKFSKDKNLVETSQAEMKEQCLALWKLPDAVRTQPQRLSHDDTLTAIRNLMKKPSTESHSLYSFKSNILNKPPEYLENRADLKVFFKNVYDWHLMFLSSGKNSPDLRIFIGCGGKQVFQLEANSWRTVVDLHITLPAKTLIYGEVVKEYRGEGNNQMYSKSLHIIDALMLGGIDISGESLTDRIHQCNLFCSALNKPFDNQALPIRVKRLYNMEQFESAVSNLDYRAMKRVKRAITIDTPDRINRNEMFYAVGSVLFIKEIKEPWIAAMSKSSGYKYYFSIGRDGKRNSEYHIPTPAKMDMLSAYTRRVMWSWEPSASAIFDSQTKKAVTRADMEEHVASQTNK
ncbi:cap-specific mRNA (nucleoside-2'-O-)-methyltransferase 1 isoform X2 [Trichoplusia ni]|uniref:Cap-specific mRNA (nucleoside-2'-O-)-methyltransferase 1 n=1 Tax=Trichoplusia ni TaxID=7111 RepID=A0A7E5W1Y3_TRINI|nr:cap-specific mRNA (nucleoside-2'-O-)-methyltransferase 1 isoform X2 [Trichoplusia ni]